MKDLIALVTGGSRGIGRAISLELARRGVTVAVNYLGNEAAARKVVTAIEQDGGRGELFQADVGRVEAIAPLFDRVIDRFGGLDILINNAGIMINTPVVEVSEEEFDRAFAVNVKGLFFSCQQAARKMRHGGRIVNIGSTVTRFMLPYYGTYAAGKGAVEQLTRVLAKELGSRKITVNTIAPGPTDTELFREGKSEEQVATLAEMSAFGRLGTPEDIARVVALVCSADSGWVSGQTIFVNGGFGG
jgi:3-oxoacyl-[acyl-carrier protein] reductase